MCDPVTGTILATSLIGAGTSTYNARRAEKAGERQQAAALREAQKASEQVTPRTRRRDTLMGGGYASTLLTGPQGLAPGSQNIGTSTLLGQ